MLPFPNYDPPPPPPEELEDETAVPPQLTDPEISPSDPEPSQLPLLLWYAWIIATGVLAIPRHSDHSKAVLLGNVLLSPGWLVLAPRLAMRYVLPVACSYVMLSLTEGFGPASIFLTMFLFVAGTWFALRVCRVIALDYVRIDAVGERSTPRLANQMQFSLRSLILFSAVTAVGISIWLAFADSNVWEIYKLTCFVIVPSELLIMSAGLGRARWYFRAMLTMGAVLFWLFIDVIRNGFQDWEQVTENPHMLRWALIPLSQLVPLLLLRWWGYRIGMPKLRERLLPAEKLAEPQSPWD